MIKRFDGANWVDTSTHRRWDGSNWVDCSSAKRWDGANWAECLMATFQNFKDDLSYIRLYHYSCTKDGDWYFTNDRSLYYKAVSQGHSEWAGNSKIYAEIRFKAVMKNGIEYNLNQFLLKMMNCNIYLDVDFSMSGTGVLYNTAQIEYCGHVYLQNPPGIESTEYYLPEGEELRISIACASRWESTSAAAINIEPKMGMRLKNLSTNEIIRLPQAVKWNTDMS